MIKKEKAKLCLVIPSLQAGGMERVMSELASYFAFRGTPKDIHLILYGITREVFYQIPETITVHKPEFRFNNKLRIISSLRTIVFLRSVVKKNSPQAVLSFGEYWNSFVLIAFFRLKCPIYVSDRCQPDKNLGFVHNFLRKRLYPQASGIIAQTKKAKEIYSKLKLNDNIRVIGNPIRHIQQNNKSKKENIVLTVGRLINTKHHDILINIFLSISKPDWKLVIVGYDHLKQNTSAQLRKLISARNAQDRIILEGKQSDVESYYLKSKIFAFTSSSEGFPNVVGEAMSARLPVIAFDCVAGPSEMIEDERNGFLVPLFDFEMFRNRLIMLMENADLRNHIGLNAEINIRKYSIDVIGREYLNFMNLLS